MVPSAFREAAAELAPHFGGDFELRFSLDGRAAVRALAGAAAVAPRHAEPPSPPASWSARVSCGEAAGWLLADEPPADEPAARAVLQHATERHCALVLQRLAADRAALDADLLERLTHRLRTDVGTLRAIADGAVRGLFVPSELRELPAELEATGAEAQRQLSGAREVMTTLAPGAQREPEPILEALSDELAAAGVAARVEGPGGERPMASVPGAGWSACARLIAESLAADERLDGPVIVAPDPAGWTVTTGRTTAGSTVPWTERALGELAHAGHIVVAAGGSAEARRVAGNGLRVALTVPAAPSA